MIEFLDLLKYTVEEPRLVPVRQRWTPIDSR